MTPPDRIAELLDATREAFNTGALIRLKLGGYHGPEADLKAVEIKKIATKAGEKYSFTYKYKTRDTIKNYDEAEALALLRSGLVGEFRSARLATTGFDLMFERNGAKVRLKRTEAQGREAPTTEHNRTKNRPLTETARPWLRALGIAGKDGRVRHDAQDKFRQINKMVENIGARRLHTVLERVMDDISFDAADAEEGTEVVVDAERVKSKLEGLSKRTDLKKFIL